MLTIGDLFFFRRNKILFRKAKMQVGLPERHQNNAKKVGKMVAEASFCCDIYLIFKRAYFGITLEHEK